MNAMGDSAAAAGERAQGAGGVHPASWGSQKGLRPDVKLTVGGERPRRFGGDIVTFEDMREFLVAYLEYEQRMYVANEDGGDKVLARRRDLVDSATQMIVADDFYDGKPWIDLSELELKKGLKRSAVVDV